MGSNFFDAIGVADMEKVHSAVIGWMLSDKCEAFGQNGLEARSRLLQNIFKIDESEQINVFKSIKAIIEWKNIDILVVTNSGEEDEKCWIIENKIKSTQHSDQLNRYAKIINCKYLMSSRQYPVYFMDPRKFDVNKFKLNPYTDTEKEFCFLTLIEEKPITADNVQWKSTKYSELSFYLKQAFEVTGNSNNTDYLFVQEYLRCISDLNSTIEDFLKDNNHQNYCNVFEDGWKPKEEKPTTYTGNQKYISDNGLETIFQKCFLSFIIPQTKFAQFNEYHVSETHGTALVNFPYKTIENAKYGFQFQNGTFKIQIVEEYNGTKQDIEKKVKAFISKWEKIFPSKKGRSIDPKFNNWDLNKSKEDKKAYISICQHKLRNSKKHPQKPWYDKTIEEIKTTWNNTFDVYMLMMENVVIPKNTP